MNMGRVGVALSGGVDSAVTALLLRQEGFEVIAYHLLLSGCESVESARECADYVGIPIVIADMRGEFERVISGFVSEYERGRTPNPCVICNPEVKIRGLWQAAVTDGCDMIATGHYARTCFDQVRDRWLLKRGTDTDKDQSYFLYRLGQDDLSRLLFPIGNLTKATVRRIAEDEKLPAADKDESQDSCFVGSDSYKQYLIRKGIAVNPGVIVDLETEQVVGEHRGIHQFTPGQRRGLGVCLPEPRYVVRIDQDGTVYVGTRERVVAGAVTVHELVVNDRDREVRVSVRHRYRCPETMATVTVEPGGTARVVFDTPQFAPAVGQSLVMYDGDVVAGGGIITGAEFVV